MAKVKTGNQEFEIPNEWVVLAEDTPEARTRRDELLRRKLGGLIPSITNGVITVREESGEQVVRVTAQLGTKAAATADLPALFYLTPMYCDLDNVHQALRDAPSYLPPVLKLAWELKLLLVTGKLTFDRLRAYQPAIQKVLEERESSTLVEEFHRRLSEMETLGSPFVPLGF